MFPLKWMCHPSVANHQHYLLFSSLWLCPSHSLSPPSTISSHETCDLPHAPSIFEGDGYFSRLVFFSTLPFASGTLPLLYLLLFFRSISTTTLASSPPSSCFFFIIWRQRIVLQPLHLTHNKYISSLWGAQVCMYSVLVNKVLTLPLKEVRLEGEYTKRYQHSKHNSTRF